MAFEVARRAVVAGNNRYRRIQFRNSRHDSIQLLNTLHLFSKVAIFASAVGVLKVNEKEIVFLPNLLQRIHLF